MRIYFVNVNRSYISVAVNIRAKEFISGKKVHPLCVEVSLKNVRRRYLSVAVDIAEQMNFYVLHRRFRTNRHGILPGDVVLLRHLHGVGTGGNLGDVVNCGIFPAALFPGGHRCGVLGLRAAVGKQGDVTSLSSWKLTTCPRKPEETAREYSTVRAVPLPAAKGVSTLMN